ncbi:MAG: N-acetyltransferase [Chloroflexota bacterium]
MAVTVREITARNDLRRFVEFQYELYRNDPNWVPPLRSDTWAIITGKNNPLFGLGPHALFLAEDERGKVVGRIMTAIDNELNHARHQKWGYFALFETVNDPEVAAALLHKAEHWCRVNGCEVCRGPVSPDNGDDYRGLLILGHDTPPVLMDSYNPPYYADLIEACGYAGDGNDRLAYRFEIAEATQPQTERVIEYARKRYRFRVDRADLKNLEREFAALKHVIDMSMPEWPDMVPPTLDELRQMAKKIVPVADPDFLLIARAEETNEPIGFLIGLPDYNQVLKHLGGRLFPFGWLKYLWYKRKINVLRIFVLFVVPAYQKKAVSHAMFLDAFNACKRKRYVWVEGSTIVEQNEPMNRDAVGAGGKLYKKFRTYEKAV